MGRTAGSSEPAGAPGFAVTGVPDLAAPEVDLASARWVLPAPLDNRVARTLKLRLRVADDRSGVAEGLGAVWVTTEDGPLVALQDGKPVSGTGTDGVVEFTGVLPAHAPAWQWYVDQFQVADG